MAQIPDLRVEILNLADDKYQLVRTGGTVRCLRYGEPWRDLTGDKMVGAMFDEIIQLREERDELQGLEENRATIKREQGDGWSHA